MGAFDDIKKKAEELVGGADKLEEVSDQVLDKAAEAANQATDGQHADKVQAARDAADGAIGNESA